MELAAIECAHLDTVPLEAALSASRRVVAFASTLALTCTGLLILFGWAISILICVGGFLLERAIRSPRAR